MSTLLFAGNSVNTLVPVMDNSNGENLRLQTISREVLLNTDVSMTPQRLHVGQLANSKLMIQSGLTSDSKSLAEMTRPGRIKDQVTSSAAYSNGTFRWTIGARSGGSRFDYFAQLVLASFRDRTSKVGYAIISVSPLPIWRNKMGVIYLARCTVNGKGYIGKSKADSYKHRRGRHTTAAKNRRSDSRVFYAALRKHGAENFVWRNLRINVPIEMLDELEKHYIKAYKTKSPNGYNLTDGGEGISNPSEETRRRIGKAHKGMKHTEECKSRMSELQKAMGPKHTPESKAAIGKFHKGKKKSAKTKAKMRTAQRKRFEERPMSKETKQKIGEAGLGRKQSQETKDKRAASLTGQKRSAETRAKLVEANKKNKAARVAGNKAAAAIHRAAAIAEDKAIKADPKRNARKTRKCKAAGKLSGVVRRYTSYIRSLQQRYKETKQSLGV